MAETLTIDQLESRSATRNLEDMNRATAEVVPVPEPVVPQSRELLLRPPFTSAESLQELTGGAATPEAAFGLGAVVGTAVGAPGGPVTAAAGGTLIGTAGLLAFRNVEDLLRQLNVIGGESPSLTERVTEAGREAAIDVALAGAGTVVRPVLGARRLIGRMFGVTDDAARQLILRARQRGVNLGAVDVGGAVPKTIAKATSVFPFTGTPARRAEAQKLKEVSTAIGSLIDELAPTGVLRNQLGVDLTNSAILRRKALRRLMGRLAKNLDDAIRPARDIEIVPTDEVKRVAGEIIEDVERGEIRLGSGEALRRVADDIGDYITQLADLPEAITVDQRRRVIKDLRVLMDRVIKEGGDFVDATRIKEALDLDFNNLKLDQIPIDQAEAIRRAQTIFNKTFAKFATFFETATAKKFLRVDRNIFGPGPIKAGPLTPDEVADIALNTRSRTAIEELENLVGRGTLRKAARSHVENALRLSSEQTELGGEIVERISPSRMLRELGLEGKKRSEIEGLTELFKRSGVNIQDLQDLLEVASRVEQLGDPSTFIKRRVILGGASAVTGAAGFGAALGGTAAATGGAGVTTVLAGTFLARRASDIIANPVALRNMTTALDTAINTAARRQALFRALRAVVPTDRENNRAPETAPQ